MNMPFGRYVGEKIQDIPTTYILWLLENGTNMSEELTKELKNVMADRLGLKTKTKTEIKEKIIYRSTSPVTPEFVKIIRNDLAKEYHPDKGGNTTAMQAINRFYDEIINLLK
jgi:uncharacterized protein (DUF3820 family)